MGCSKPTGPETLVIAQLAPEEGPARAAHTNARRAVELAVAGANADGPAFDGRHWVIVQPNADDKADDLQRSAVRLIKLNRATALIADTDATAAERLCRVAEQYHVPLVTTCWLPARTLRPYGFTVAPAPAARAKALADSLPTQPVPHIALLVDRKSVFAVEFADALLKVLPAGAVVIRLEYADAETLKASVGKTTTSTAIVLAGHAAELSAVRAELASAKVAPEVPLLFGGEEEAAVESLAASTDGANPIRWTTPFLAGADESQTKEFVANFTNRYQSAPGADAALAFDAVRALFEAQRQAKSADGTKVRDQLATLKDFAGVSGPLNFGPEGASRPVLVVHQVDGQIRLWAVRP
jgi:branched-chain amino acid transport system substrate-binding protein